jgi:hypothetical protein
MEWWLLVVRMELRLDHFSSIIIMIHVSWIGLDFFFLKLGVANPWSRRKLTASLEPCTPITLVIAVQRAQTLTLHCMPWHAADSLETDESNDKSRE